MRTVTAPDGTSVAVDPNPRDTHALVTRDGDQWRVMVTGTHRQVLDAARARSAGVVRCISKAAR